MIGFLHAGAASHEATVGELARRGNRYASLHLVEPALVDPNAREFRLDDGKYAALLACARRLALQARQIVLTCSVYNGAAAWLSEDLGIPVERSDAAGARALLATEGPVGVLLSYAPTVPVVVDYLSEVFAKAERNREIRAAVADAMPFTSTPEAYRRALLAATSPLRDCGALFVAQYSMHPYLADIRAAWRGGPIVSAVAATVDELRA